MGTGRMCSALSSTEVLASGADVTQTSLRQSSLSNVAVHTSEMDDDRSVCCGSGSFRD